MKSLFYGGNIITMDTPSSAEAVLVEDGRILAIGNKSNFNTDAKDTVLVNLDGATLMPAFIDPHSHFFQVATSLLQVSLDGADSAEEIRKRIQHFIAENNIKPGQWVNACDYDNNLMPQYKNPTIEQIDSFAPDNPLIIHHKSGHMGLLNTKAFEFLGITPDTPSPEGGKIEKADGKLTGYLEENGLFTYLKKIPMPSMDKILDAVVKAQDIYASYGITTVQEGMVAKEMLPLYDIISRENLLKLDVNLFMSPDAYDEAVSKFGTSKDSCLHVSGIKIFLDGSPQGRTAWMRKPYADSDSYCAYGTMTDELVESAFKFAAERKTQLIAHCNGDAAAEQFLRCLEKTEKDYPVLSELRPVIIHGQLIGLDQLPRAKKLGAMISFFVAHVYHWADVHIRNFGMERASRISPVHSAMKNGIKCTFHQDAPVIAPDMLETVWCAVNRITKNGVQLSEDECLSVYDAFKAVTVNAAYQYSMEDSMGSLAVGKRADFVLLDKDPFKTAKSDLKDIKVLKTYKDGEVIYSAD